MKRLVVLIVLVLMLSGCQKNDGGITVEITNIEGKMITFVVTNNFDGDVNMQVKLSFKSKGIVSWTTDCFIMPAKSMQTMYYESDYDFDDVSAKVKLCK
jgi:hypothetical protein